MLCGTLKWLNLQTACLCVSPARLLCLLLGQRRVVWKPDTSWKHQSKLLWCCSRPPGQQPEGRRRRTDWRSQKAGTAPGNHQMYPKEAHTHLSPAINKILHRKIRVARFFCTTCEWKNPVYLPGMCSCRPPVGPVQSGETLFPPEFFSSGLCGSSSCCVSFGASKAGKPPWTDSRSDW